MAMDGCDGFYWNRTDVRSKDDTLPSALPLDVDVGPALKVAVGRATCSKRMTRERVNIHHPSSSKAPPEKGDKALFGVGDTTKLDAQRRGVNRRKEEGLLVLVV